MSKKSNTIIAGLVVCAVSSAASASNSTNEETLNIYKGEYSNITKEIITLDETIEIHKINPSDEEEIAAAGKKRRHNNYNVIIWLKSLWANADSVKAKDHHFS